MDIKLTDEELNACSQINMTDETNTTLTHDIAVKTGEILLETTVKIVAAVVITAAVNVAQRRIAEHIRRKREEQEVEVPYAAG